MDIAITFNSSHNTPIQFYDVILKKVPGNRNKVLTIQPTDGEIAEYGRPTYPTRVYGKFSVSYDGEITQFGTYTVLNDVFDVDVKYTNSNRVGVYTIQVETIEEKKVTLKWANAGSSSVLDVTKKTTLIDRLSVSGGVDVECSTNSETVVLSRVSSNEYNLILLNYSSVLPTISVNVSCVVVEDTDCSRMLHPRQKIYTITVQIMPKDYNPTPQLLKIYENMPIHTDVYIGITEDWRITDNPNFSDQSFNKSFISSKRLFDQEIEKVVDAELRLPNNTYINKTIEIMDVNDNSPVFTNKTCSVITLRNTSPGQYLTNVFAEDADLGMNGKINYKVISVTNMNEDIGSCDSKTNFANKFKIDPNSGQLYVNQIIENAGYLLLNIQATDSGSQKLFANIRCLVHAVDLTSIFDYSFNGGSAVQHQNIKLSQIQLGQTFLKNTATLWSYFFDDFIFTIPDDSLRYFNVDPYSGNVSYVGEIQPSLTNNYTLTITAFSRKHVYLKYNFSVNLLSQSSSTVHQSVDKKYIAIIVLLVVLLTGLGIFVGFRYRKNILSFMKKNEEYATNNEIYECQDVYNNL
ncbi:protocadherin Fat 3-like [Octopus sinensis]|uniref:Protocadherin Fat 3-like n=1 Tax=Octopus sinensis TaxID=2607531 RepID=A0A7E6EI71_9MOLL|nr:protocadherin Fat 3-like [Octopus sinensis]